MESWKEPVRGNIERIFIKPVWPLLTPQIIGKLLHIPETVQYKRNVLCGWLSPLNHVTYYMHNFGYDNLPRIWQSCLILFVLSGVNLCVIHWLAGRYEFQFS